MWLVPLVALMVYAAFAFHRVVHAVGAWMVERGWTHDATSFQGLPLSGARWMLESLITLNLSFLVFTFASLLVALQAPVTSTRRASSRRRCCATTPSGPSSLSSSSRWRTPRPHRRQPLRLRGGPRPGADRRCARLGGALGL